MNETTANIANGTTSVRNGKDLSLDSPLLNLILAASLLSKITRSKTSSPSFSRSPLRYSESYYDTLPWYPHEGQNYYKLQASLHSQPANYPVKQHIIHIHRRPLKEKPEVGQNGGQSSTTDIPSSLLPVTIPDVVDVVTPNDEISASPSSQLTQELKDFLTDFFKKNLPIQTLQSDSESQNSPSTEMPEINFDQENGKEITSEQLVENMSETMVDKMTENLPENATQNEVKHMSETVIQNLPASILENIPPEMLERISEKISEQISEKLSEKFSKDVSNHMLEKLAQLIPERSKDVENDSDKISEENSEENKIIKDSQEMLPVFSDGELDNHIKFVDGENLESQNFVNDTDYREGAASSIDLQAAETHKTQNSAKHHRTTDEEYVFSGTGDDEDDEEDDEDTLQEPEVDFEQNLPKRVSPKFSQKIRLTTDSSTRKNSKGKLSPGSQTRINSKKPSPNKRRTTPITLIYDEDEATPSTAQLGNKRKVQYYNGNIKKGSQRRRTTSTTPTYEDYYNDPVDQDYADQDQDQDQNQDQDQEYEEATTSKPRPGRRTTRRGVPRQQTTTTEGTTVTDTGATDDTTLSPTTPSGTTPTPTPTTSASTSGEYPYYGNNNYGNISITYGPPVHHYPGYGPSNGNEQVSFTYAPPSSSGQGGNINNGNNGNNGGFTGLSGGGASASGVAAAGVAPMLDNWYNQYARASMYKRLQDLLTPNNFYNQYDVNYNDASQ